MCQILNLLWEMTVLNVAFVSACFCGGHKDNFPFRLCFTDNFWSVSLKFGAYNITSKRGEFSIKNTTLAFIHFFDISLLSFIIKFVFLSFSFLYLMTYLSWTLTFYKKIFYLARWKMMKNAFYFIVKALFVLKVFKFLSWLFGYIGKGAFPGLIQFLPNESPLKTMKNAFYFTSKALFFLKFLSFKFLNFCLDFLVM